MSKVLKKLADAPVDASAPVSFTHARSWVSHWELYLITFVAAFLRLYRIDRTEFNADQADIFQMAHSAVSHVHLVATSNIASIGIFNPPGIIYFLMLAAMFSSNPLAGSIFTAILSILSVMLTYVVICRYYGRLIATIAASLYAVAAAPIFYSRFMWNQNLLLFFVPLFISVLLYGVIERRKGWFAPAVVLVGLLAQLHGSGFLLMAPLAVAFVLAPGTIRVRDIVLGLLAFLLLYSTYFLWLDHSHYRDAPIFLASIRRPSTIDNQALIFFQQFLSPYGFDPNTIPLTNGHSLLFRLSPLLLILTVVMVALVVCSVVMAIVVAVRSRRVEELEAKHESRAVFGWRAAIGWWSELRASPYRCALWVLLSWQLVPLLYLLRHSIPLHTHYFIMFMPGPFILLAIFIVNIIDWTKRRSTQRSLLHVFMYGLTAVLIFAQFLGGLALVLDTARGNFNADYNRFNDLSSLQHALGEADQLAQSRHLKHVYISTDDIRRSAFYYLAEQMHTSTTVFTDSCVVLPDLATGPAVLLAGPESDLTTALIGRFAKVTLVDQPARLAGVPFGLYIMEALPPQPAKYETLGPDVQFLGTKNSMPFTFQQSSLWVTRWEFLHAKPAATGITYTYSFTSSQNAQRNTSQCVLTAVQAGDQFLVPFVQPVGRQSSLDVQEKSFMTRPDTLSVHLGNAFTLNFDTYNRVDVPQTTYKKETLSIAFS